MGRRKKYDTITHYLKNNGGSQITLTFTQFDAWLNAGYEVVHVNLKKEYVVFNRLVKSNWLLDRKR